MFDIKPTTAYRFPKIHDLFLAFVPLKTQVPYLVEYIESCLKQSNDSLLNHEDFVYKAPPEGGRSSGLAVKEGRAFLRTWTGPNGESGIRDRVYTESRVSSLANRLDYFHKANREWRRQIEAVRKAIDEAASELDQRTTDLLKLPSIQVRLAVDDLSRAVPYDGLSVWDHPDYPPFEASWVTNIKELWPPVGKWMQRTRSIGHMEAPISGVVTELSHNKDDTRTAAQMRDDCEDARVRAESESTRSKSHVVSGHPAGDAEASSNEPKTHALRTKSDDRAIVRSSGAWMVRFDGEQFPVRESVGLNLLAVLLFSPHRHFKAAELYRHAEASSAGSPVNDAITESDGFSVRNELASESTDPVLDEEGWAQLSQREKELLDRAALHEKSQPELSEECLREAAQINKERTASQFMGNHQRDLAARKHRSATNGARQNIQGVIEKVRNDGRIAFADHLERYIQTGAQLSYQPPPESPSWSRI